MCRHRCKTHTYFRCMFHKPEFAKNHVSNPLNSHWIHANLAQILHHHSLEHSVGILVVLKTKIWKNFVYSYQEHIKGICSATHTFPIGRKPLQNTTYAKIVANLAAMTTFICILPASNTSSCSSLAIESSPNANVLVFVSEDFRHLRCSAQNRKWTSRWWGVGSENDGIVSDNNEIEMGLSKVSFGVSSGCNMWNQILPCRPRNIVHFIEQVFCLEYSMSTGISTSTLAWQTSLVCANVWPCQIIGGPN